MLVEGDKPTGGKWFFDSENRKRLKQGDNAAVPSSLMIENEI